MKDSDIKVELIRLSIDLYNACQTNQNQNDDNDSVETLHDKIIVMYNKKLRDTST